MQTAIRLWWSIEWHKKTNFGKNMIFTFTLLHVLRMLGCHSLTGCPMTAKKQREKNPEFILALVRFFCSSASLCQIEICNPVRRNTSIYTRVALRAACDYQSTFALNGKIEIAKEYKHTNSKTSRKCDTCEQVTVCVRLCVCAMCRKANLKPKRQQQ